MIVLAAVVVLAVADRAGRADAARARPAAARPKRGAMRPSAIARPGRGRSTPRRSPASCGAPTARESALGALPGRRRRRTFADFLAGLDAGRRGAASRRASTALRASGDAVRRHRHARRRHRLRASTAGARATGDSVLWARRHQPDARDRGGARGVAGAAAAALRAMFDAVPLPVWRRDRDLALVDCNAAYAAALDTTREAALAEGRELAPESGRGKAPALAPRRRRRHDAAAERAPRRDRRLAPAHRDHRDARPRRRHDRLRDRPHRSSRTPRPSCARHINAHGRGARKHPRRGRDLRPRQAAQLLQFGVRRGCGASRRIGSPASRRSTRCWSGCASAAAFPNSPISAPSSASSWRCSPR